MPSVPALRTRVVEAAGALFLSRGFVRVTSDDIAARLGISKATLYKVFSGKEDILREVVRGILNDMGGRVEGLVDDASLGFVEKMVALMSFLGTRMARFEPVFIRDLQKHVPEIWKEIEAFRRDKIARNFKIILEAGRREGYFRGRRRSRSPPGDVRQPGPGVHQSGRPPAVGAVAGRNVRVGHQGLFPRHRHRQGPPGLLVPDPGPVQAPKGRRIMRSRSVALVLVALSGLACAGRSEKNAITASGTIEAIEVNVASKVAGQILTLAVEEGARVRPGDVLATIDHATADIQLRQAEAGIDLARAQLALLRNGARREDIQQAEAALKQTEASLQLAAEDARRMRELFRTASVTAKQRDDAEARLTIAEAQRASATEAVSKVRRLARPEEIQAAEARLAQAEATRDLLAKSIADCAVIAPAGGIVTHKAVEAGELVSPGATVVTLAELDSVYVMIYLAEREIGRVRLGDTADVEIDAFPGRPFPGRVTYISPEAEFTPKNVQTKEDRVKLVFGVKVEIENKEGLLKPGLPADAAIRVVPEGR